MERIVVEVDDKDMVKFEPFCPVDSHHLHVRESAPGIRRCISILQKPPNLHEGLFAWKA
jgi:hypothetical protein